jgi:hypothetical protein
MKRFFSLALALCMTLSLVTVSAFAAITAGNFTLHGKVNTPLYFTAKHFEDRITTSYDLVNITVTDLPDDGTLKIGPADVAENEEIVAASLSSLVFIPDTDFSGITEFKWTATDSNGATSSIATATLDFTVEPPVAHNATHRVFINTSRSGTLTATNPSGYTPLTFDLSRTTRNGTLYFNSRGTFTYTPDKDFVGTDTFTFTVSNPHAKSAIATITLSVSNVLAPTASNSSIEVNYHGTVNGTLTGFDPNIPALGLGFIIETQPTKGSITSFDKDTGRYTYQHRTAGLVSDHFTFRTTNGYRESNNATVTIKINPPAPTAYRDMTTHWAGFSAGVLKTLDLAVGEEIQKMFYFNPSKNVTRREFALFLNSVMGIPLSTNKVSHFADVHDTYLIESLNALYERGISTGTLVGTRLFFYPERTVTRIEAMRMIDNAMRFKAPSDAALNFSDSHTIPSWAVQSVRNLVGYKIVTGHNGFLRPTANITRAEVAELMYKAYLEHMK